MFIHFIFPNTVISEAKVENVARERDKMMIRNMFSSFRIIQTGSWHKQLVL
ncbi:hypothetical protein THF5G08_110027 [Vibrio jasicida]|nr:hypothetical protein THF5G08_110027 [Vibrio jasicida]